MTKTAKSHTRGDAAASKAKILAAAQTLFSEYGYNTTTFKKISEEAGVAFGLIPHYFGNKERLFVASSVDVLDEIIERVDHAVDGAPTGLDYVMELAACYLNCAVDTNLNFKILISCSPYSDLKLDINKEDVDSRFDAIIHRMQEGLRQGIKDGSIIDCDPERMSFLIFSTIVGTVRRRLLAAYCPDNFFAEYLAFVRRSIERT